MRSWKNNGISVAFCVLNFVLLVVSLFFVITFILKEPLKCKIQIYI